MSEKSVTYLGVACKEYRKHLRSLVQIVSPLIAMRWFVYVWLIAVSPSGTRACPPCNYSENPAVAESIDQMHGILCCILHIGGSFVLLEPTRAGVYADGTLRLVSHDGSPSINGAGRLDMLRAGVWGSVCSEGFTPGSAGIACK